MGGTRLMAQKIGLVIVPSGPRPDKARALWAEEYLLHCCCCGAILLPGEPFLIERQHAACKQCRPWRPVEARHE